MFWLTRPGLTRQLCAAIDALDVSCGKLRESLNHASRHIDVWSVLAPADGRPNPSIDEFGRWLGDKAATLAGRAQQIGNLCSLLKTGRDLDLGELPSRLNALTTLSDACSSLTTGDLAVSEDGEVDWTSTLNGLRVAEQFDPLLRIIPDLREILVDPSRIEKDGLLRAAPPWPTNTRRSARQSHRWPNSSTSRVQPDRRPESRSPRRTTSLGGWRRNCVVSPAKLLHWAPSPSF